MSDFSVWDSHFRLVVSETDLVFRKLYNKIRSGKKRK